MEPLKILKSHKFNAIHDIAIYKAIFKTPFLNQYHCERAVVPYSCDNSRKIHFNKTTSTSTGNFIFSPSSFDFQPPTVPESYTAPYRINSTDEEYVEINLSVSNLAGDLSSNWLWHRRFKTVAVRLSEGSHSYHQTDPYSSSSNQSFPYVLIFN